MEDREGRPVREIREIPFFVTDSKARIPRNLRVSNISRLQIGEFDYTRLPADRRPSGKFIEIFKSTDRRTEKPQELVFDERGNQIDAAPFLQQPVRNRIRKYGKLHEALFHHLESTSADDPVDIAIWFAAPKIRFARPRFMRTNLRKLTKQANAGRQRLAAANKKNAQHLTERFQPRKIHIDELAPVVYASLTSVQIQELTEQPEVLRVFLHEREGIEDLDDSMAIANSDDVHAIGIRGAGVKVAVWENGPDKTDDLVIKEFYDPAESNTSEHARHTHAIVKNKEKCEPKGHARACSLYSANDKDLAALRWAVKNKGCTVISQSFHRSAEPGSSTLSYDDIYKDWLALNWPYPTILQAAGNYWDDDPDDIDPPNSEYVNHKGYNSLAVGNHDDQANAMSATSVFRNPVTPHGDRELPEISANGTSVTTVDLTKSGTSMAAPAVAGAAALMQNADKTLKHWPEGCRAILLAGAKRNVTDNTWWQDVRAAVDAHDGSGALDALESVKIAQSRKARNGTASKRGWDVGGLRSSNFDDYGMSTFSYKVKIPGGNWIWTPRHVKIALAWTSEIGCLNFWGIEIPLSSTLTVDLDLLVYDSNGNLVARSESWDNSYEIAEFNGTPGSEYTIKIRRWSGTDLVYYGLAWTVSGGLEALQHLEKHSVQLEHVMSTRVVSRRWRPEL
ncbi:S8 family serine peptidase [Gemmatimonadota bacterium]